LGRGEYTDNDKPENTNLVAGMWHVVAGIGVGCRELAVRGEEMVELWGCGDRDESGN